MAVDKFPIEAGHIMLFARSIGDANPIYYDESYAKTTEPGAVVAPPTFVQASAQFDPDYFLRPKIGQEWFGSAKGPTGITEKKAVVVAVPAADSMPNNTTSITSPSKPATP